MQFVIEMADTERNTMTNGESSTHLLTNETSLDKRNESAVSRIAQTECDLHSNDGNNKQSITKHNNENETTFESTYNNNINNNSNVTNTKTNAIDRNGDDMNECKEEEMGHASIGFVHTNRPFFTLPRLLSGRRKRMKRKALINSNDSSVVSRIEEQPETESIGRSSVTTTNTSIRNANNNTVYVKENFFIRLMRHLASPVHSVHNSNGQYYSYGANERNSLINRRSKHGSIVSSASNGNISRSQVFVHQTNNDIASHPRDNQRTNGFEMSAVCGIKNHGNTCFMNAVIQCLCNTDLLAEYFVMNHYRIDLRQNKLHARKYGTKGEVTEQLVLLLKSLWSCQYSSEISSKFKLLVAKYGAQYEGSEQHDAQEFLLWLLDKCHEDLNIAHKKKYKKIKAISPNRTDELIAAETLANHIRCNRSFIHDLFQAQLRSSLVCRSCNKHSNTFDPYLCLSLPVPTRWTHTLFVNSVYLNKTPKEVKIGVSIESLATLRELRDKISRLLKIPEKQLVLLLVGQEFGLKELTRDTDTIQEILDDMEDIYAVETPKISKHHSSGSFSNNSTNTTLNNHCGEQVLTLVWTSRIGIGSQGKFFGSLFSTLVSREASFQQIQIDILSAMQSIIKPCVDINSITSSLNLRLRVIGGIPGKCYLPEDVDHPLYMPTVDKALTGTEDKDYRGPFHLKLVVEWDLDVRNSLIICDEDFEKPIIDSSTELVKARSQKNNRATLQDCFDLYFKEEKLVADNAWMCPACKSRQQCVKKLSLWSVPDIFIIHLKRFRQTSNSQRSKLTTLVLFPQNGLEMSSYLAPRYNQHTNGSINNSYTNVWSPWKSPRMFGKLARSDDNTFDLYAVCNHHGNMQSGHYTAYCRNPIDGCWYLFDDTKVIPVQESSVITSDAYILFYHRSSLSSALSSCASSSTSGYSSNASSYFCEHWSFRMPPFNYWPPKSSKSHDDLLSDNDNGNSAKLESIPQITPSFLTRGQRAYASLPSKTSQHKAKILNNKLDRTPNDSTNTKPVVSNDFKNKQNICSQSNDYCDNNDIQNSEVYASENTLTNSDDSKYWAITSV